MKSARLVLLDLLLLLNKYGDLLAVLNFLDALAVSILLRNLGCNCYSLIVILLLDRKSNQTLSDFGDFLCLGLCCDNSAVVKKLCNLVSE